MIPTPADVDRIAALPDPVIRNLQITACYHALAVAMAARTGPGANWCTFATWASRQAGQTIRKEDFVRTLENALRDAPVDDRVLRNLAATAQALGARLSIDAIRAAARDLVDPVAAMDRAADAVGRGNRKVFEEIGREFARFIATCLDDVDPDAALDDERIARFCDGLRPGDPPDGQRYLRQAFRRYHQALAEPDAATSAQLLLLANVEIGFHEQTRLQPEIAEAMNAALADRQQLRQRLIERLFPRQTWLLRSRLFLLQLIGRPSPLDTAIDGLLAEAERVAHRVVTETMMTIGLPHGKILRLGEDLSAEVPPALRLITLPDLQAMLAQIDPTPDSMRESGAVDWSDLPDRLHFIVDLFRSYHASADLFEPPFTADQIAALKAGRLPQGRL
jgi:hypothetical protein